MTRIVRGPKKEGGKNRSPFVISLCLHSALIAVAGVMLYLSEGVQDLFDRGGILLMDEVQKERQVKRMQQPKQPHLYKERLSFKESSAPMRQADSPRAEAGTPIQRALPKDAMNAEFEQNLLTDIATEANLPTEVTGIRRAKALFGPADGIGKPTGRANVPGSWVGDSLGGGGTGGDGGPGGGPGVGNGPGGGTDALPWIVVDGPGLSGRVVFVLDVSASMAAAGLYKLELAKEFLVDQIYRLEDTDDFNIITFAGKTNSMEKELLKGADEKNIRLAQKYLDKFTQESILNNQGTNTLAALLKACAMQPDVIALLTDGRPTGADGAVMTDPETIVDAFKKANQTNAALLIFGMEIDDREGAPGAVLLNRLAASAKGKARFISRDELIRFKRLR